MALWGGQGLGGFEPGDWRGCGCPEPGTQQLCSCGIPPPPSARNPLPEGLGGSGRALGKRRPRVGGLGGPGWRGLRRLVQVGCGGGGFVEVSGWCLQGTVGSPGLPPIPATLSGVQKPGTRGTVRETEAGAQPDSRGHTGLHSGSWSAPFSQEGEGGPAPQPQPGSQPPPGPERQLPRAWLHSGCWLPPFPPQEAPAGDTRPEARVPAGVFARPLGPGWEYK